MSLAAALGPIGWRRSPDRSARVGLLWLEQAPFVLGTLAALALAWLA